MAGRPQRRVRLYHLLLLLPFVALWVPFYNRAEPSFEGIPFFYWYQMAWIVLTVVVIMVVYHFDHRTGGGS